MSSAPFVIATFAYSRTNTIVSGPHAAPEEGGEGSHVGFLGWAEPQEKAAPVW